MPDLSPTQTAGFADDFFARMAAESKQLESSQAQLVAHIRNLGVDRDKVVKELERAQRELAGVSAKLKAANDGVAELLASAQAEAAQVKAAAKAEAKNLLDAMRAKINAAQKVLEGVVK